MGCCASTPAALAAQASKDSLSEYLPKASLTPRSPRFPKAAKSSLRATDSPRASSRSSVRWAEKLEEHSTGRTRFPTAEVPAARVGSDSSRNSGSGGSATYGRSLSSFSDVELRIIQGLRQWGEKDLLSPKPTLNKQQSTTFNTSCSSSPSWRRASRSCG